MNDSESFSREKAIDRYLILMHEIDLRVKLVAKACKGDLNLSPPFAREYAYLQFRKICELLALGCQLLHGDLATAQTIKAKREWNAEKIMKRLLEDHPHVFPQSVSMEKSEKGWHIKGNFRPNAISLEGFKKLYIYCGYVLHRGSIRSLELKCHISTDDYKKVMEWQSKLVDLISQHLVPTSNGRECYYVSFKEDDRSPECSFFSFKESGEVDVLTRKLDIRSADRT
jgi:hypothetical protein